MRPLAGVLAGALLTAVVVAGCGSDVDPDDPAGDVPERFADYCAVVREEQPTLSEALARGARVGLLDALPSFQRLREASPDDLADEWSIVVSRVEVLRDALSDAGVDPATYDPLEPPQDLTDAEIAAIEVGASSVAAEPVQEALDGVEQQARDVCKTPLVVG